MKDREILERLARRADRYLVALLREALADEDAEPNRTAETWDARHSLFDALEDAEKTDVFK